MMKLSKKACLISSTFPFIVFITLLIFNNFGKFRETSSLNQVSLPPNFVLPKGDNIIFVVIDTLRADHLPLYGYNTDTAPFLSQVGRNSIVFENAFSTSSHTAPSMASIFTSTLPRAHGVITGFNATKHLQHRGFNIELNRISDDFVTLGEVMKRAGYSTLGVSDNLNIGEAMQFTQGFDTFMTQKYLGAESISQIIFSWQDKLEAAKPYFLYIHFMDPHEPYNQRAPWYSPSANRAQDIRNAYDSEIRYLDGKIQTLFSKFGWLNDSLVVVLSDHGEEFWDHGQRGHGRTLFREVIRVPLFIFHRNLDAARRKRTVQTIDLLPTLASIVSQPREHKWHGRNLFKYTRLDATSRYVFSELLRKPDHPLGPARSVVLNELHFLQFWSKLGHAGERLFNMESDPQEVDDLRTAKSAIAENLTRSFDRLGEVESEYNEQVEVRVDKETIEHLQSLGYLN